MADVEYTMHQKGATWGAVSGRFRSWLGSETITAPDGEFTHLSDPVYTARVIDPKPSAPTPSSEDYEARLAEYHTGNGWYDVPGVDKKLRREDALAALTDTEADGDD